jgi:lysophospholipase L1-like esterase
VVDGAAAIRSHAGGTAQAGFPYFYDTIHPTRLGHAVLGEAIAPAAFEILDHRSNRP